MRRLPILSTLLVLAAVGVMIALGLWQLDRKAQKEAMLARYAVAQTLSAEVPWPSNPAEQELALFRRTTLDCRVAGKDAPLAGYDRRGTVGWAHTVTCELPNGARAETAGTWPRVTAYPRMAELAQALSVDSRRLESRVLLLDEQAAAGFQRGWKPFVKGPEQNWSYAIQWWSFAILLLVLYVVMNLKKRSDA